MWVGVRGCRCGSVWVCVRACVGVGERACRCELLVWVCMPVGVGVGVGVGVDVRELHPVRAPHLLSKFWVCPEGKTKILRANSRLTGGFSNPLKFSGGCRCGCSCV